MRLRDSGRIDDTHAQQLAEHRALRPKFMQDGQHDRLSADTEERFAKMLSGVTEEEVERVAARFLTLTVTK